jgi:tetratricopeptide (TPR) repeat protein
MWAHYHEAGVLHAMGELEAADEACRLALDQRSTNSVIASFSLQLQVELGDLDGALARIEDRRALSASPATLRNDLAWHLATAPEEQLGGPEQVERAPDESVRLAESVVEMIPEDANAYNTLSIAQLGAGDPEGALESAEKAMVLGQGGATQDWLALSLAHQALGDRDEARLWFELADSAFEVTPPKAQDLRYLHTEAARGLGLPTPFAR